MTRDGMTKDVDLRRVKWSEEGAIGKPALWGPVVGADKNVRAPKLSSRHYSPGTLQRQNLFDDCVKVRQKKIAVNIAHPGRLEKQRSASRRARSLRILPLVADDKRPVQIQMPFKGGFNQESRLGLATG